MFREFLLKLISHGTGGRMEQALGNRIRRINLFFLILSTVLAIATLAAVISWNISLILINGSFLIASIFLYWLIPAASRTVLKSFLALSLAGGLFLIGYLFDVGISGNLVLAFYLLFPLAAVSLAGKQGAWVSLFLGTITLGLDVTNLLDTAVDLGLTDRILFYSLYGLLIIISLFTERLNRDLVTHLDTTKSQFENEIVEKDEFIARLSHKLRTSLSNLTLINNLVHDERLSSEQKELMETLKASTNNLIEDVNNIVEIASPGIVDYKQSIISLDLTRVLEEAVSILETGGTSPEEVSIIRSDRVSNYLIGDPSLLRSLIVQIIKGLEVYSSTKNPIELLIGNLRESPNQVRLEFKFRVETDLGNDLVAYVNSLKREREHKLSSLANAHYLLQQSESELIALSVGNFASISFFLDFTKDATRTIVEPEAFEEKRKAEKKGIELKNANVLLVEDNAINQKIVLLSLAKKVNQIDVAVNGKEAVEMFDRQQYDLILMDIMMPVMDGLAATKKIREIESTTSGHIPIIAITANALPGDRENCLAAGADEYVAKPFQVEHLIQIMKGLLA